MAGNHSVWLGAVLLVGCGFEAAPLEEDMEIPPGGGTGTIDPVPRKCTTADSSLRLCIDFEDTNVLAGDGSGKGHHPLLAESLTMTDRDDELAVMMSAQSRIHIAEHADLDIATNLTVSMWMMGAPASSAYWLLDNNTQYSMSLQPNGSIRCGLGSTTVDSAAPLNIGGDGWHHVACTHDGNRLKVYIDGWVAGCRTVQRAIATDGREGLSIGSNVGVGPSFTEPFVGGLDNVQVFARTWSDSELCAGAGNDTCNTACPTFPPGGGRD